MQFIPTDQIYVIVLNFFLPGQSCLHLRSSFANMNNSCTDDLILILQHYSGRIYNLPFFLFLQGVPKLLFKRIICILLGLLKTARIDTTLPKRH